MEFSNMEQATVEDCSSVTNLKTANITSTGQVVLYSNRLSTKEADNVDLQTVMNNLQGYVNKLKSKFANLNRAGHSGGSGASNKER